MLRNMDACSIVRYKICSSANSTAIKNIYPSTRIGKKDSCRGWVNSFLCMTVLGIFLRNMGTRSGVRYTSSKCQLKDYHQNSTCSSVGFSENLSLNCFWSKEENLAPSGVRKEDTPAGHGKTQQPEHH